MRKSHVIRIFISSTFKDMHAEREEIVRSVLPQLRNISKKKHVLIEDIDLRWGVSEEQTATAVCRQEIDRSDIFICLLGQRYGTVPEGDNVSVTHDEILYGVLDAKSQKNLKSFFYFRDKSASMEVPIEQRNDYWETEGSMESNNLQKLKDEICTKNFPVYEYKCLWNSEKQCSWNSNEKGCFDELSKLGQKILDDLSTTINTLFPDSENQELNPLLEQQNEMDYFIAAHTKIFVGRDKDLEKITKFIKDSPKNYLLINGSPGCGKSSLLAKFCNDLSSDSLLFYHFVGASSYSTDVRNLLQRLCYEISKEERFLEPCSYELLRKEWSLLTKKVDSQIIIVIDAVNQLQDIYSAQELNWLPQELGKNVKIIISTLPSISQQILREHFDIEEWDINKLEQGEKKEFVEKYLAQYGKTLDSESIDKLLQKKESDHPLYLKVVLEECRTLGGNDIYLNIKEIIASLPDKVSGVFESMFQRLEKDSNFGRELIFSFLSALAVSRGGMQIGELRIILKRENEEQLPAVVWARLYHLLSPYLVIHGDKLTSFHQQLELSIKNYYLNTPELLAKAHESLEVFFTQQSFEYFRSLEELAYHTTNTQNSAKILALFNNIHFLEKKCKANMLIELIQDFETALQIHTDQQVQQVLSLLLKGIISEFHNITRFPDLLFQQVYNKLYPNNLLDNFWQQGLAEHESDLLKLIARYPSVDSDATDLIQTISAHEASIYAICGNYKGEKLVTGAADNTVKIWSHKAKKELRIFEGHNEMITALAISKNEKIVVSAGRDASICVWYAENGDIIVKLQGHKPTTTNLLFNSREDKLFSVGGKFCVCWDTKTWQELYCLNLPEEIKCIAIDSGDERLICAHGQGSVSVYSTGDLEAIQTWKAHEAPILSLQLSSDENWLVTSSQDNTCKVWNLKDQALKSTFSHDDWVYNTCFIRNSKGIASAGGDKLIKLWDIENNECIGTLHGHTDWVYDLVLLNESTLASVSEDHTLRIWNIDNAVANKDRIGHNARISSICQHPLKNEVVTASFDKSVQTWQLQNENKNLLFSEHDKALQSAVYSPNGKLLAIAGDNSFIQLYDLENNQEITFDSKQEVRIFCLAFSPDSSQLASASRDYSVKIWDVSTQTELFKLSHNDGVECVVFSSDGSQIVSCARDGVIYIWDSKGNLLSQLKGHQASVEEITLLKGRSQLASVSLDKTVRIWDLESKSQLHIWELPEILNCIDSHDSLLACGCEDKTVHLWDLDTKKHMATFVCEGTPQSIKFTNNSLLIGDEGGFFYRIAL